MKKFWTIEEELKLKELVGKSLPIKEVCKLMNRSYHSCRRHADVLKLKSSYDRKIYTVNEHFWKNPNPLNSYWAGFSAADASVQQSRKNSFTYRLEIQKSDEPHLRKLMDATNFTGKMHDQIRPERNSHTVRIGVTSKTWFDDLNTVFNIMPNKTKRLAPPVLEKSLMYSWLIGYTDGDGNIHLNNRNDGLSINYSSSSQEMIKWINNFVVENFPESVKHQTNNYKKYSYCECWHYSVGGVKACVLFDYLRRFPVPKLARKWENPRVLEYVEKQKQKYPHLFKLDNFL